ncbi:hypothetical protein BC629DRAFT_1725496 [Irpex lacteus]|nr:hypothetical protein BC629DRAFT_1725496 [Irpex lacteus]
MSTNDHSDSDADDLGHEQSAEASDDNNPHATEISVESALTVALGEGIDTPLSALFHASPGPTTPEVSNVSSTFHVGASLDERPADLSILSSDHVLFIVHSHRILSASTNHFANLIIPTAQSSGGVPVPSKLAGASPIVAANTPSDALSVVLHCIYRLSPAAYLPSLQCIISVLPHLTHYGLTPLSQYVSHGTPLLKMFLLHAQLHPIPIYALAASQGLEDLAVAASSYTLSLDLAHSVSHHYATLMSSKYLFKLYKLHGTRIQALKTILDGTELHPHAGNCSPANMRQAKLVFALACHRLYRESSPGMPREAMESVMHAEFCAINCQDCMQSAKGILDSICSKWLLVAVFLIAGYDSEQTRTRMSSKLYWLSGMSVDE